MCAHYSHIYVYPIMHITERRAAPTVVDSTYMYMQLVYSIVPNPNCCIV